MAKINQTQRNHMLSRLDGAINQKMPDSPETPEIFNEIPDISYPRKYYTGKHSMDNVKTLDKYIKWMTKNRIRLIEEYKNYIKNQKQHEIESKRLVDLKTRLRDELMLGNDLQDLINVLKKVEAA